MNVFKRNIRKGSNPAFVFALAYFVFLAVLWGQGNMRDILFRHIPSGADLMTRDLKMYMLGKGRAQPGRDRRGGAGRRKAVG